MKARLGILAFISLLPADLAPAGINWKAVWLEPQEPVVVTAGESKPYAVWGLNGGNVTANLTRSPYLKITSSDLAILEIDRKNGLFVGRKAGFVVVRFSFSEASNALLAKVEEKKTEPAH